MEPSLLCNQAFGSKAAVFALSPALSPRPRQNPPTTPSPPRPRPPHLPRPRLLPPSLSDVRTHRLHLPLDLRSLSRPLRHFQIIKILQIQPELRIGLEVPCQTQGRLC